MPAMVVIDTHAHIALLDGLDDMRRLWEGIPRLTRREPGYFWTYEDRPDFGPLPIALVDPELRLRDMNQNGVDHQVISLRPKAFGHEVPTDVAGAAVAIQNDALIRYADAFEGRLSVYASLPMQAPEAAAAEIRRVSANPLVRGVTVDANMGGRDVDGPEFEPVWAALEAADLPVQIHPNQEDETRLPRMRDHYLGNLIGNPVDTTIMMARLIFSGVPDRYPRLRWLFLHAGGAAPYLSGRWDHAWRVRADVGPSLEKPPSEYLTGFYFDMIAHSDRSLRFLADMTGWDRIVVGTDYPFDMGFADPALEVARLGLSADDEANVLSRNAEGFLRPM